MRLILLLAGLFFGCGSDDDLSPIQPPVDAPPTVVKSNPMKVFMHYMPWFQSKPVSGYWGSHWTMNSRDPEVMDANGQREIAAHYYPLIGPYDSKDPDVLEYHTLLMKYAGIDGVLIDWYGTHNVYDYRPNFNSTNAFIDKSNEVGLKFGIVYEEYTAENVENQTSKTAIEAAQEDLQYLETEYFSQQTYVKIEEKPLLMTFGPRYFKQQSQWNQIFEPVTADLIFLPLWHHAHLVGNTGDGEFSWVDFNSSLSEMNTFYNKTGVGVKMGSAYPRFNDYYQEAGLGAGYGRVYSNDGETLRETLDMAREYNMDFIQLVTWNDFGEGTQIEPTAEDGFLFLEIIQEFTGVPYGINELEMVHSYYLKKKEYKDDTEAQEALDQIYEYLINLKVEEAKNLLSQL